MGSAVGTSVAIPVILLMWTVASVVGARPGTFVVRIDDAIARGSLCNVVCRDELRSVSSTAKITFLEPSASSKLGVWSNLFAPAVQEVHQLRRVKLIEFRTVDQSTIRACMSCPPTHC